MKTLPKKAFFSGPKQLKAWRLPTELIVQIEKIAREDGWTVSDITTTALDQYVQAWKLQHKKKKR